MSTQHVIRAARDPKPEQVTSRLCPCGCGKAPTGKNRYATYGCSGRMRQGGAIGQRKSTAQNPTRLFLGGKRSPSAPVGSWWLGPLSRDDFMATAAKLHPDASNARASVPKPGARGAFK